MKIATRLIYLLLALPMAFASCSSDSENGGSNTDKTNKNANTTEKSEYATRIEMPQLKKGNNYLLLVKTSNDIGVNYTIEWDCINRAQRWTCWEWNAQNAKKGWKRDNWREGQTFNGYGGNGDPFQPDTAIPEEYRSELSDYSGSGYNRGHICASEDRIYSKEVNGQTYYLSNIHPQLSQHNTGIWSAMESKVRSWRDATVNNGGTMYIVKGGTIGDVKLNGQTVSGVAAMIKNRIPVPKYFFMAIVKKTASGIYTGMAFWTEHKPDYNSNVTPYMITINELEERTGFDLFCNLPDNIEEAMEGTLTPSEWK